MLIGIYNYIKTPNDLGILQIIIIINTINNKNQTLCLQYCSFISINIYNYFNFVININIIFITGV